jgi:hypothetical protein
VNEEGIFVGNPQLAYVSIVNDINLFLAETIHKYNLSSATQESYAILSNKTW